jgi:tetratricopeptide (TPR) repeat protein
MTYNHPLWSQVDEGAAKAALARLAPNPEARAAAAGTEVERGFMTAIEALYGEGAKGERDLAYHQAMDELHQRFPAHDEVTTFLALAVLGTQNGERDFATYMRAAATAAPVFQENPDHPGAAHYLIHSFDDPIHSPLGLAAARAYSRIAPAAAHAQHMTSHIFLAMGMWDDVVQANEVARDVQNAREMELDRRPSVCGHYTAWLEYGYLMQGRTGAAEAVLDTCYARIQDEPSGGELNYFASMRARFVLDTEDWGAAKRYSPPMQVAGPAVRDFEFVTGMAALRSGDVEEARRALAAMQGGQPAGMVSPQVMQLEGLIALRDGDEVNGLGLLRAAAAIEESLPYEFGPPAIVKPTHELLGEALLAAGEVEEARQAFETALARTPLRANALRGLDRAAAAGGDEEAAARARAQLESIRRAGGGASPR